MDEPPALPTALGIEAVQWLPGGENVTVRVRGRWRRGRPTWSGQPLLVVEALGRRHRFPAMPEPPSPTGAAPGTWQMSFSIPASLPEQPGAKAWLQLGGAVVAPIPLPVEAGGGGEVPPSAPPDRDGGELRRLQGAEEAAEAARERAAHAEAAAAEIRRRIAQLEHALRAAHEERQQMRDALSRHDRARRSAEQRAHAERAMRLEIEQERARETPSREPPPVRTSEDMARIRQLEEEVDRLIRAASEAGHLAQAAVAARSHAEERLAAQQSQARAEAATVLRHELALTTLPRDLPAPAVSVPEPPDGSLLLRREHDLLAARATDQRVIAVLRAEIEGRAQSEARLRSLVARLQARRTEPTTDFAALIAELRRELGQLRAAVEREIAARAQADAAVQALQQQLREQNERTSRAYRALGELRDELAALWPSGQHADEAQDGAAAAPDVPTPAADAGAAEPPPAPLDPGRLDTALSRLRGSVPEEAPPDPGPRPRRPWLQRALRELARRDPASAGEVLMAVLRSVSVEPALLGVALEDPPGVARLITTRRIRPRFRRRLPRRAEITALRTIVGSPPGFGELVLEPLRAFDLLAAMVDPRWTTSHTFRIAYRRPDAEEPESYLAVRDRRRPESASGAPAVPADTTVVCPAAQLASALAGGLSEEIVVEGRGEPLELVRDWLERAQSG